MENTQEGDIFVPQRLKNWREQKESKLTVGVAFSGGGTRSATLTLGQLRSLNALGFIDKINYISAVSGGAWAAVPFTYHSKKNIDIFLGEYTQPNKLSDKELKRKDKGSFAKAISKSNVFWKTIKAWGRGKKDESFAHVINKIFLKPFELHKNKFFTSEEPVLTGVLNDNPNLSKSKDFYFIKEETPFLIVGATLQKTHWKLCAKRSPWDVFPLEITPLYIGIPTEPEVLGKDKKKIGGGYIEPFIYDSVPPKEVKIDNNRFEVTLDKKRNRFTLSDVIASSGAAPQEILTGGLRYTGILSNLGFPEFRHWPITEKNYEPRIEDYVHGDGGNIDNIGLLPLLSRQVDNIIVFVNTEEDFDVGYDENDIPDEAMYSDLKNYFIHNPGRPKNIIFHENKLSDLYKKLSLLKEKGEPLVSCGKYKIKRNQYHNIFPKNGFGEPYTPNICWVYNDKPSRWVDLIKKNTVLSIKEKSKILNKKGPYKAIPHTKTFFQRKKLIDRSIRQVNSESNISSWVVCESADLLAKFIFNTKVDKLTKNDCSQQNKITKKLISQPSNKT